LFTFKIIVLTRGLGRSIYTNQTQNYMPDVWPVQLTILPGTSLVLAIALEHRLLLLTISGHWGTNWTANLSTNLLYSRGLLYKCQ